MSLLLEPQWQVDRAQLNHNWLQNGVLVALNHALGICVGSVIARNPIESLTSDMSRWAERQADLAQLLDRFDAEMSPRSLFDRPPLSRCSQETQSWLPTLTHELWLQRKEVHGRLASTRAAFESSERAFVKVHSTLIELPAFPSTEEFEALRAGISDLIENCLALSEALSSLPKRIYAC